MAIATTTTSVPTMRAEAAPEAVIVTTTART
jgi:hypothetical protein